jgi:hypothetical protein
MEITGKKITEIRHMTFEELELEFWESHEKVVCIVLEDGSVLIPSKDFEGNGPGSFFLISENNTYTLT